MEGTPFIKNRGTRQPWKGIWRVCEFALQGVHRVLDEIDKVLGCMWPRQSTNDVRYVRLEYKMTSCR